MLSLSKYLQYCRSQAHKGHADDNKTSDWPYIQLTVTFLSYTIHMWVLHHNEVGLNLY
jgi:hypothetical protein